MAKRFKSNRKSSVVGATDTGQQQLDQQQQQLPRKQRRQQQRLAQKQRRQQYHERRSRHGADAGPCVATSAPAPASAPAPVPAPAAASAPVSARNSSSGTRAGGRKRSHSASKAASDADGDRISSSKISDTVVDDVVDADNAAAIKTNRMRRKVTQQQQQQQEQPLTGVKRYQQAVRQSRNQGLLEANRVEMQHIRQLEAELGIRRRHKKHVQSRDGAKWPTSFYEDGLDYFLDVTNSQDGSGAQCFSTLDPESHCDDDEVHKVDEDDGTDEQEDSACEQDDNMAVVVGDNSESDSEHTVESDDSCSDCSVQHSATANSTAAAAAAATATARTSAPSSDASGDGVACSADRKVPQLVPKAGTAAAGGGATDRCGMSEGSDGGSGCCSDDDDDDDDDDSSGSELSDVATAVDKLGANNVSQSSGTSLRQSAAAAPAGTEQARAPKGATRGHVWEDIYGRLRDKNGDLVEQKSGVYVPPALRAKQLAAAAATGGAGDQQLQLVELRRRLQGALNRLSSQTMRQQLQLVTQLFGQYSRNSVNETLTQLVHECCVTPAAVSSDRIVAEHALLIAALHATVGTEVGGHFLQKTVAKLNTILALSTINHQPDTTDNPVTPDTAADAAADAAADVADNAADNDAADEDDCRTDKTADNLIILLAFLYCFQVMDATVLLDLLALLASRRSSTDIRLILATLQRCGFQLRRRQPLQLKQLLQLLQQRCSAVLLRQQQQLPDTSAPTHKLHARVRFMLDALMAIKNNNMAKLPGYDHQLLDELLQLLRTVVKAAAAGSCDSLAANQLSVSLNDLINAEVAGKWWVVGSAWTTSSVTATTPAATTAGQQQLQQQLSPCFSRQLLQLARKHHMNTELRRNVFCILMSAEDYVDAFERLMALGVRGCAGCRQLVSVVVHCGLREKRYNPFYCHLLERLCRWDRRYQLYVRLSFEEYLTDCGRLVNRRSAAADQAQQSSSSATAAAADEATVSTGLNTLSRLVASLMWRGALSLTLLQSLELSQLDSERVQLLRLVLLQLFAAAAAGDSGAAGGAAAAAAAAADAATGLATVFARPAGAKLRSFRNSLTLFMRHFMTRQQMAPLVASGVAGDVTMTSYDQCLETAIASLKRLDRSDEENLF